MSAAWTENLDWHHVQSTLAGLPAGGERSAYVAQVALAAGRSASTIYRELARRFGRSKIVARPATAVTDEDVRRVALVKEVHRDLLQLGQRRELSTEAALDILAEQEGYARARDLCPSSVNAALRRSGYRETQRRVRVEASHACQQFQIDFSRSKYFQVIEPTGGGDWLLRTSTKELHYKDPKDGARLRAWVVQIVDEYSRLRVVRYFAATGEDRYTGMAALHFLLNRPADDHLMRHIPERLKSDQGAFLKSQEARSACQALGIDVRLAGPGNKESQGKVESGFRSLWQRFESALATSLVMERGPKATVLLSDLSRLAHRFAIREHDLAHPTFTHQQRGAMYQQSVLRHRPKEVDHDVRDLALRTWERWADATGLIKIDGVPFEVPVALKWVRIYRTLSGDFAGTVIDGYRDKPFTVRPYRFRDLDDFEDRAHRTFQQEMAAEAAGHQKALAHRLQPATTLLTPTTPVLEARQAEAQPACLSKTEALAAVGRALAAQGLSIRQFDFGGVVYDGITQHDLDQVIAAISIHQRKAM